MKKRFLLCLLCLTLLMLAFISGCGKKEKSTQQDKPEAVVTEQDANLSEDEDNAEIEVEIDAASEVTPDNASEDIGTNENTETKEEVKDNSGKRVVCLGDSLTVGTGGDGTTMPDTIAALSGAQVLNYGGYGESASCIAARQGGNPQYLVEDIVIPADCTPVRAQCSGKYGYEMLLVFSDAGINNVVLGGVEGTYSMVDDERCFTRLTPGDEVNLPAGTQLFTHAMLDKRDDDILVIWAGSNNGIESEDQIPTLVEQIDEMIAFQGNDAYVVVSLTSRHGRIPLVDKVNESLKNHFGNHYLDLRSYMVNEALSDLNITPTELDKKAIEIGDVPVSIRYSTDEEENHGNADFYRLAGEQIYKKLVELGYLN